MEEQFIRMVIVLAGFGCLFIITMGGLIISDLKNDRWFPVVDKKDTKHELTESKGFCTSDETDIE